VANTNHSCGQYSLESHFAGKEPAVRDRYDQLLKVLESFGPVAAYSLKSRIVFQADTPFAMAVPRKHWLEVCLWLRRRATHPALRRIEMQVFRDFGHIFRLENPEDLDVALVALLQEAYLVGCGLMIG
jgi:hypothetical protein